MLADVTSGIERKGGGLFVRPGSQGWEEAKEEVIKQEPMVVTKGGEDMRYIRARLAEADL